MRLKVDWLQQNTTVLFLNHETYVWWNKDTNRSTWVLHFCTKIAFLQFLLLFAWFLFPFFRNSTQFEEPLTICANVCDVNKQIYFQGKRIFVNNLKVVDTYSTRWFGKFMYYTVSYLTEIHDLEMLHVLIKIIL